MSKRERPLRFAIIGSRGFPSTYGGFETFVRRLAPYLSEFSDVTVYGRDRVDGVRQRMVDGVSVICTPGIDRKSTSTLTFGATASIHAARQGFDAALVLNVANGFFLPLLSRAGVPTAVNVDGIEWARDKWGAAGKAIFRRGAAMTARFADRIVVDSEAIGDYWGSRFDVRSTFIPYGADVLSAQPTTWLDEHGLASRSYVLVVARLVPENNVDLLLDALERTENDHPLVVVGSAVGASPLEDRLRALSAVRKDMHWLGHVSDQELLNILWSHCGLYVHGHSVGGTNPALLQALGAGSPTCVFDTPYNREVVQDACPVYAGDPGELGRLIDEVMSDPLRQSAMSAAGQEIVRKRYAWDDVLARYRDLLVELTQGSPLRP